MLHVCHIHRVLMQPRGNALLVGVGGSGRKSLSRLATYVADQKCFSIEISKGYRIIEFREDLKSLYRQVKSPAHMQPDQLGNQSCSILAYAAYHCGSRDLNCCKTTCYCQE